MPSVISKIQEVAISVYAVLGLCLPCFLCWDAVETRRATLSDPRPLPIKRIDVRQNQITAQPPRCHLLRLPAELRELIFEMALGRRVLNIVLVPLLPHSRRVIRTKCYRSVEEINTDTAVDGSGALADRLPVTFLRSCRQVYLEALPILHQSNTFYCTVNDFMPAMLGALGEHSFKDIRKVHLTQCSLRLWPWRSVFPVLARMALRSLTLEFQEAEWTNSLYSEPPYFSLDSQWCRDLLSIRKLERFEMIFKDPFGAEDPVDREAFKRQLCELMLGPYKAEV
ncbi:hypothetical protein C8J57DRAFT_459234 [Mycena rebaudengoi]|nr:hypothetical protein C8J57DRAFT_459234 [Mycena rebaudengoi]